MSANIHINNIFFILVIITMYYTGCNITLVIIITIYYQMCDQELIQLAMTRKKVRLVL